MILFTVAATWGSTTQHQLSSLILLKKLLTGTTGLHSQDRKLIYKDKRKVFQRVHGYKRVRDMSKMVLLEAHIGQEKCFLEMRKNGKIEKSLWSISEISYEVYCLAIFSLIFIRWL
ncbi:unnamed protein product [Linum trigynum]|uniref:Uncharacterized protein n=1 Tax=Linum trigynum TaxID=586398 RepID=A0AAV2E347_9ROSI